MDTESGGQATEGTVNGEEVEEPQPVEEINSQQATTADTNDDGFMVVGEIYYGFC